MSKDSIREVVSKEIDISISNQAFLFNAFIKKTIPDLYAHYIDSDDNLAEAIRGSMQKITKNTKNILVRELESLINREVIKGKIEELKAFDKAVDYDHYEDVMEYRLKELNKQLEEV